MADDHPTLRDSLARMLEDKGGFKVVGVADNGKDTIAAFENGMKADVLLLDINMPNKDGYETAAWMKEKKKKFSCTKREIFGTFSDGIDCSRWLGAIDVWTRQEVFSVDLSKLADADQK